MNENETLQIIKDFVKDFEQWAMNQHSENLVRESMKYGWVHNMSNNIYSKFVRSTKDQIYWINICAKIFQEKFNTTMSDELKYKLFIINLMI